MKTSLALASRRDGVRDMAGRFRVTNVRAFGSVPRGDDADDSDLFALVVDLCESAWRSVLPLSQRGNEGDLATFAWVIVSEIPLNPPLRKGEGRTPTSSTANVHRADDSGLDLLVDPLPGATLFDLGGLKIELETPPGVPVDLLTPGDLPLKFRKQVLAGAMPV